MSERKYRNNLYHHGIKGQKWGVRRFQNEDGSLTLRGKQRYNKGINKQSNKNEETKKRFKLTNKQKHYLKIGVTALATGTLVYTGYRLYKSGKFDTIISKGSNYLKTKGIEIDSSKKQTVSKIIKNVNPSKSRTNCRACSMASVFRLRGLDVDAVDIPGGKFSDAVESCFVGAKVSEMYNPSKEKVVRYMTKRYKEGDYGAIAGTFTNSRKKNMSHAFNWIVKDGTIKFFDGQKELDDCSSYLDLLVSNKTVEFAKLNDAEINLENMYKFVKKRK